MSSSSPAHLDVSPRSGTANGSEDNKNAPPLPPSPQREPNQQITMSLNEPATPVQTNSGKGKRKADDVDGSPGGTPPDGKKQQRATFAADPRPHRASGTSGSSHAPSSYSTRKRARLSVAASTSAAGLAAAMSALGENKNEAGSSKPPSRSNSRQGHHHNGTTGTWTSSRSRNGGNPNLNGHSPPTRSQSRASRRSFGANTIPSPSRNSFIAGHSHADDRAPSRLSKRGSISGASIPISALISPHAPSVSRSSAIYHMRDPHKPPRVQPTPWSLSFPQAGYGEEDYLRGRIKHVVRSLKTRRALKSLAGKFGRKGQGNADGDGDGDKEKEDHDDDDRELGTSSPLGWTDGGGSPLHAWLFFAGFIIFPLWWIAGCLVGVRKTRRIGSGQEGERGVVLDDPQVEHDAKTWRSRCRIMALVSLVTYVPFIVLVAVFAPS